MTDEKRITDVGARAFIDLTAAAMSGALEPKTCAMSALAMLILNEKHKPTTGRLSQAELAEIEQCYLQIVAGDGPPSRDVVGTVMRVTAAAARDEAEDNRRRN